MVDKTVDDVATVATSPRLFACFDRCELAFFLVESTSFTETAQSITRKWEVVDSAWFETVRGVLERSMDSPKSLERLFAVGDLYDRAREMGSRFFHAGWGGVWGGGREVTEADMDEIDATERRVREWRESRGIEPDTDPWTAAERRDAKAGIVPPKPMTAPKREIGVPANGAEIPEVGTVVHLTKRMESFGGFIPPGPATITAAGVDHFGKVFVSLSRDELVVANLVAWPIEA